MIGVKVTITDNPISEPLEDDPEPVELHIPDPDITPDQGGLIGDPVGEEYELRKKDRDQKIELSKVKITLKKDGSVVAEVEFPSLKVPPLKNFLDRAMLRHPQPNLPLIPHGP